MKNLANILNASGDAVDKAHAEGVHVGGERYVVTKIEDRSAYCRLVCIRYLSPTTSYLHTYIYIYVCVYNKYEGR